MANTVEGDAVPPEPPAESTSLLSGADTGEDTSLLGASTEETVKEEATEDLSDVPFYKRLGKKKFWGNIGSAIKRGTSSAVKATSEGAKALATKETWVGEKGAFGKQTWAPVGASMKSGFDKVKQKDTWVGQKGVLGKETWAGETGVFGSNNRAKAKALVDKAKSKISKKSSTDEDAAVEEDEGTKKEKERIALTMLKEGQISQEEYDQLVSDMAAASTSDAATESAPAESEPLVPAPTPATQEPPFDGRDSVDTADL